MSKGLSSFTVFDKTCHKMLDAAVTGQKRQFAEFGNARVFVSNAQENAGDVFSLTG